MAGSLASLLRMDLTMVTSKIDPATVTRADLHCVGSIPISVDLVHLGSQLAHPAILPT